MVFKFIVLFQAPMSNWVGYLWEDEATDNRTQQRVHVQEHKFFQPYVNIGKMRRFVKNFERKDTIASKPEQDIDQKQYNEVQRFG